MNVKSIYHGTRKVNRIYYKGEIIFETALYIYPILNGNILTIEQVYKAILSGNVLEVE